MFKFTRKILYGYTNYPNIQKQHLINLIERYNSYLYSELDKTNCDVEKTFIKVDLSNVVDIQNKLNLNQISEEDINKNIKYVSDKFNLAQNKSEIKS
jgi:hypothetical protein